MRNILPIPNPMKELLMIKLLKPEHKSRWRLMVPVREFSPQK